MMQHLVLMLEKYAFDRREDRIGYVQCQSSQRSGTPGIRQFERSEARTRLRQEAVRVVRDNSPRI